MEKDKDNPGVYIPPPLIYVILFVAAVFVQKKIVLPDSFFHQQGTKMAGVLLLVIALPFLVRSLVQFFQSKNTLVTIRPAASLQTTGIFAITRNPMYVGLAIVYLGISCLTGNWWHIIFFPVLILIVQEYIIKREEQYLSRRFGEAYMQYRSRVRRWF